VKMNVDLIKMHSTAIRNVNNF